MRLLHVVACNFGSYERLEFDFDDVGLALVQGRTGAGKSTIADVAAWALFGVTAKNGNADEVKRWNADGGFTTVHMLVETQSGVILINRVRGARPSQHDLWWTEGHPDSGADLADHKRGKDMADTQRLLEARLGVTADLYLTGAYFHEFSPTGQFFNAKAKERRAVFEGIANLALPVKLAHEASEARKTAKTALGIAATTQARLTGKTEGLDRSIQDAKFESAAWEQKQKSARVVAEAKAKSFEDDKQRRLQELADKSAQFEEQRTAKLDRIMTQIEELAPQVQDDGIYLKKLKALKLKAAGLAGTTCATCGQKTSSDELAKLQASLYEVKEAQAKNAALQTKLATWGDQMTQIEGQENPYMEQVLVAKSQRNVYAEQLKEAEQVNPYDDQLGRLHVNYLASLKELETAAFNVTTLEQHIANLTALYDLSFTLRAEMVKKAVSEIETETNRILETFFDAEIRVGLAVTGDDSLDVTIQKGGYECVYRQLSKGQRGLLKLAFVVSVMKAAANKAGVHFANLFFDEALDGLDSELKVKAFGLFEELATEHESILLIDHAPEFQNLFTKRYLVTMSGDTSTIEADE